MTSAYTIERARPEDAAALLDYLKIIGGETDNLSFGPEGVPLSVSGNNADGFILTEWGEAHVRLAALRGA